MWQVRLPTPLKKPLPRSHRFDCSRSFISLLDSFSVLDSEGDDITASFTPMQHDILIAIILYTADEGERHIREGAHRNLLV
jgi:hypothetical protein